MKHITFKQFIKDCKSQIERNTDISEDTENYLVEDSYYSFDKVIDGMINVFNGFLEDIALEASNILNRNFSDLYGTDKYSKLNEKTIEVKNLMDKFIKWTEIFKQAQSNMSRNFDDVLDNRIEYMFVLEKSDVPNSFSFSINKDTGNDDIPDEALDVSREELLNIAENIFEGTNTKIDIVTDQQYNWVAIVSLS